MRRLSTNQEYWAKAQHFLPEFMESTYEKCEGPFCGLMAAAVMVEFQKELEVIDPEQFQGTANLSYHTFYRALRDLGYTLPVSKSYDSKTRITGIKRKGQDFNAASRNLYGTP